MDSAASALEVERKAIYEWARGDANLLSARCAKAEETLRIVDGLLADPSGAPLDAINLARAAMKDAPR